MTDTYVCARCGREFGRPSCDRRNIEPGMAIRPVVRIGGREWCSSCASARFKRRSPRDAYGIDHAGDESADALPSRGFRWCGTRPTRAD